MDLPYKDTKPQGAADFYFAINATFAFLLRRRGREAWIRYLEELGRDYFKPVSLGWKQGGLPAVASYWRAFFAAEPGAEVEVTEHADRVECEVRVCPALRHLKAHGRDIVPEFCQHCYQVGQARAAAAGMSLRVAGGNGSCRQTVFASPSVPPQDLRQIKEVTS